MGERKIPETLEEAYRLRDTADSLQERDFYQEQVYHLRREEYRSRGIRTEISSRRRERQSAIEFSREMFFLEVAEISRHGPGARETRAAQQEARKYATRLDTHAFLKQLASPIQAPWSCTGATTWSYSGWASLLPKRTTSRGLSGLRGRESSDMPSRACVRPAIRPGEAWPTPWSGRRSR